MYKRLSNHSVYDLSEPMYIDWDGIYGYLVESHSQIYHFYNVDEGIQKQCVTEYFEKLP
jgi:hypothetical protein